MLADSWRRKGSAPEALEALARAGRSRELKLSAERSLVAEAFARTFIGVRKCRMRGLSLSRCTLSAGIAAALLAGCSGSQPPIGAPGAMPQALALAAHASRGTSWMLTDTSNEDLLYASGRGYGVEVLSYPKGTVVGQLTFDGTAYGLCSDRSGDVFIPVWSSQYNTNYIYEYAHGGTEPIATLTDSGVPFGCAVDPMTGNLAVTNVFSLGTGFRPGNVAIYADAQGTPTYYSDSDITIYGFCAYDDAGNLFVTSQRPGEPIGELPEGSGSFENITTNLGTYPGSLQWHDGDLVVAAYDGYKGLQNVYQLKISGTYGTVVGKTTLQDWGGKYNRSYLIFAQFWVEGASIIGPSFLRGHGLRPSFWHYPKGGKQVTIFRPPGFRMSDAGGSGVTISVAPSHSNGHE